MEWEDLTDILPREPFHANDLRRKVWGIWYRSLWPTDNFTGSRWIDIFRWYKQITGWKNRD